jgi:hypothetical protein
LISRKISKIRIFSLFILQTAINFSIVISATSPNPPNSSRSYVRMNDPKVVVRAV